LDQLAAVDRNGLAAEKLQCQAVLLCLRTAVLASR
jgi:hypothetical protein